MPSLVSHSAQSAAWIFECRKLTVTSASGHARRRAYISKVIEVHAPKAASRYSYGDGPDSVPPADKGSSADIRCGPIETSCLNPVALPWTTTLLTSVCWFVPVGPNCVPLMLTILPLEVPSRIPAPLSRPRTDVPWIAAGHHCPHSLQHQSPTIPLWASSETISQNMAVQEDVMLIS